MLNAMIVEPKDNVIVAIEPIKNIGLAARDIKMGEHVHCHNLEEHRENLDAKG